MGVTARGRWLFGVSSREVSSPHPRMGGWEIPPPRGGGRHQSCVGHRSSPPMRGEEAPPPRGGQHPPLTAWAPVILLVRVVWHSYQVVRRVGSGRGPWGCGARATALGVVVGCAQHVQAECYRGVRGGHGIRPCGAGRFVCARAYVRGHFSHRILSLVTQSIARTVEVSELPAAARVVAAVGVVIYNM